VDWGYLEGVLQRLGFHSKWVQWTIECVTTVRYSVRFNNVPLNSSKPSRSLRGDPLSPYLFLVVDGLSQILQQEVHPGVLKEVHICRRAPGISHLLFADDMLLFVQAEEEQAIVIKNALRLYERYTGQLINPKMFHHVRSWLFCTESRKVEGDPGGG
jgi:hypothetical protein